MTASTAHTAIPEATDEELASRRDVAILYERYARRLAPFLASQGVAGSDLDDLHQEVWVRVWNALGAAPFQGHFRGWLFQVARNLVIDHRRRRPPAGPMPEAPLASPQDSPVEELTRREVVGWLGRCLERLEGREADVFRDITGGADYDEVCQRLGINKNAAYKLFHHAKSKLASCMERAAHEPCTHHNP